MFARFSALSAALYLYTVVNSRLPGQYEQNLRTEKEYTVKHFSSHVTINNNAGVFAALLEPTLHLSLISAHHQ